MKSSAALRWQEGESPPTLSLPPCEGREAPFVRGISAGLRWLLGIWAKMKGCRGDGLNAVGCRLFSQYLGDKRLGLSICGVVAVDGGGDRGDHAALTESRRMPALAPDPAAFERL